MKIHTLLNLELESTRHQFDSPQDLFPIIHPASVTHGTKKCAQFHEQPVIHDHYNAGSYNPAQTISHVLSPLNSLYLNNAAQSRQIYSLFSGPLHQVAYNRTAHHLHNQPTSHKVACHPPR